MIRNNKNRLDGLDNITIVANNLAKQYIHSGVNVLEGLNFEISHNGIFILTGKNGSGKTTLCNIISSLDTGYHGELMVNNIDLKSLSNKEKTYYRKKIVSYMHQNLNLFEDMTVMDNCMIVNQNEEKIMSVIQMLRLSESKNQKVIDLSGGQKQRVALARAILQQTKILILDEPFSAIDSQTTAIMVEAIKQLSVEKIILIVSHDIEDFARVEYEIMQL